MRSSSVYAVVGAGLLAGAGALGAVAISQGAQAQVPQTTATITLTAGPTGPAGPAGPTGPAGTDGLACPTGFVEGVLVINHPGGQVTTFTCIKK